MRFSKGQKGSVNLTCNAFLHRKFSFRLGTLWLRGSKSGSVNLSLTCFSVTIFRPLCVLVGGGGGGEGLRESRGSQASPQPPVPIYVNKDHARMQGFFTREPGQPLRFRGKVKWTREKLREKIVKKSQHPHNNRSLLICILLNKFAQKFNQFLKNCCNFKRFFRANSRNYLYLPVGSAQPPPPSSYRVSPASPPGPGIFGSWKNPVTWIQKRNIKHN